MDPRDIVNGGRLVEVEKQIRLQQTPRILADHDDAPRRIMRKRGPDRDFRLSGKRRKTTDQDGFLTRGRREVQARRDR